MTGQQLKNSILQMAIQGRLVLQDPHDEPASVLLDKIRKEKARLVKEGKLKKKDLEETPISEEEKPFDIPNSWIFCRLSSLISVSSGDAINKNEIAETNKYPVYGGNGIIGYCNDFNVAKETIIIGRVGAKCGNIHITNGDSWITDNALIAKYNKYCIDIKWLCYALESLNLRVVANQTAQPVISGKTIYPKIVALPPLAEQRRIVEKFESLMPLIESYGKSQEALNTLNASLPEKLRQSILQEAIQGHLVPQDPHDEPASILLDKIRKEKARLVKEGKLKKKDIEETPISTDEIPFEIPNGWEWCRMRDLCNFATPNKKESQLICLDARYLRGKGDGIIMSKGNYVNKGKYIILVDGENSGEVFITPCEGFLGSTFKELLLTTEVCFDYIKYIFLMIKEELRQNKRGAAIPHLDKTLFFEHLIPLPPLNEQHRIVAKIEEMMPRIDRLFK